MTRANGVHIHHAEAPDVKTIMEGCWHCKGPVNIWNAMTETFSCRCGFAYIDVRSQVIHGCSFNTNKEKQDMHDKIKLNDVEVPVDEAVAALRGLGYTVGSGDGRYSRTFSNYNHEVEGIRNNGGLGFADVRVVKGLVVGNIVNQSAVRDFSELLFRACNWSKGDDNA